MEDALEKTGLILFLPNGTVKGGYDAQVVPRIKKKGKEATHTKGPCKNTNQRWADANLNSSKWPMGWKSGKFGNRSSKRKLVSFGDAGRLSHQR